MATEILKHLSAPASPRPWSIVAGESGEGVIGDADGVEIAAASMGDCVVIVEAVNERDSLRSEIARLTAEVEAMREVVEAVNAAQDEADNGTGNGFGHYCDAVEKARALRARKVGG